MTQMCQFQGAKHPECQLLIFDEPVDIICSWHLRGTDLIRTKSLVELCATCRVQQLLSRLAKLKYFAEYLSSESNHVHSCQVIFLN